MTAEDFRLDGLSVLVLEDEYILAEDAARLLLHAGAQVLGPFATAEKALAEAARAKPDCALLDLNLGTGLDFGPARRLRALGVPVVLFSGYDETVIPTDFRQARFLQKPFHMPMIVNIVAEVCGRSSRAATVIGPWRSADQAGASSL